MLTKKSIVVKYPKAGKTSCTKLGIMMSINGNTVNLYDAFEKTYRSLYIHTVKILSEKQSLKQFYKLEQKGKCKIDEMNDSILIFR